MPGGTGEIGGGSCRVCFRAPNVRPKAGSHYGNPGDDAVVNDGNVTMPFNVTVTFPDNTAKVVTITGEEDKVWFQWPWPPRASASKRKPRAKGKARRSK